MYKARMEAVRAVSIAVASQLLESKRSHLLYLISKPNDEYKSQSQSQSQSILPDFRVKVGRVKGLLL